MTITLKQKKNKDGMLSLYLEYYQGSTIDNEGKRKHIRRFEYLKLYIHSDPKDGLQKKYNKEQLLLAENILAIRKAELLQGKYSIQDKNKSKQNFLTYFKAKTVEKQKDKTMTTYDNWLSTFHHLEKVIPANLTFNEVDEEFAKKVRRYFEKEAITKSKTPLSQNSKYSYFNKFKACLRSAFDDGIISTNIASKIKSFEQAESQREYLTFNELKNLANTHCKYENLKKAFLFSCLTGIRWSDINNLIWSEVREDGEQTRIHFRQQKTDGVEYLYISNQARELLGDRQEKSERVFKGLKYSMTFNTEITRWCMRAGITKHITFHSARHTNAVLLLENGADIYTVSKMLGHREIRTTSIYAKIVDNRMQEAANLIPRIK